MYGNLALSHTHTVKRVSAAVAAQKIAPHQFITSSSNIRSAGLMEQQRQPLVRLSADASSKTFGQKVFGAYEKSANLATNLFPVWTVLFTALALKSPQSFAWFTTEYFTAALAALMLSMGITLTPDDFVQVAKQPAPTIMQFLLCYGMMPVLALTLGKAFKLNDALIAGMVLVGSINGGQASNLCTYIARGNVALSVLMTTATTLGAIFMTPILCKALLGAVVPVDAAGIAVSTIQVRVRARIVLQNFTSLINILVASNNALNLLFLLFYFDSRSSLLLLLWACP